MPADHLPAGRSLRPAGRVSGKSSFNTLDQSSLGAIMKSKAMLATAVACLCVSSVQSASADNLTYEWYTVANNGDVMPTDSSGDCGSCHEDMASSGGQTSVG